jgi:hypothetical protein
MTTDTAPAADDLVTAETFRVALDAFLGEFERGDFDSEIYRRSLLAAVRAVAPMIRARGPGAVACGRMIAAEREACAQVMVALSDEFGAHTASRDACLEGADKIRARGEPTT